MLKKFLTNNLTLAAIALILFAIGFGLSLHYRNFQWLSRFGALIICVGIILLARPNISGNDIKPHIFMAETTLSHLDRAHYLKTGKDLPDWVIEDGRSRTAVGWLGPLLCLIGTGTNGFADLLNRYLT